MNPFPGLRPFTQLEDYLFFGREEQTIELLQRLGGNRFVAVVGTSGSGKSSLVRCGLLSELLGGGMIGAGASWEIAVTHPGGNPLALLTDALLDADLYDRREEHARENLLATLSRSHFGLVEAVKQADVGEGTNFLLVVDQFEEIFRFHEAGQTQQEAANEFVSLLLEAVAQKEVPIYVVLTMRSDFIGECGQFEGLAEMVNRGEFLIPRLTREQYKRVIEGPIKVAGGQIAPRLLQRLLNDLGQQADQLPCLQHALMRTWTVWTEKGDTDALDLDDYQRVGKMSQALSLHADEIYESLASDRQRALCQGIFQALTVEESNSRGIRRPQRLGRLCQILDVAADELLPIIDAYRHSGVTFLMPSPEVELTDQTIIDISHESLMRVWTRLRQWVEEETQAAGIYHRLSESADLHERGKAGLYRDPELGIALAWREAKRPNAAWAERYRPGFAAAIEFLEASRQASVAEEQAREAARQHELEQAQQLAEAQRLRLEQQQRAARKLRKLIAGVAVVAVIAAIACVAALMARDEASKNAQLAEQSQQKTATALTQVEAQKAEVESSLAKAEKAEHVAQAAEEAGRKLLYTTDMRLAPFMWGDDRTTAQQLRALLAAHNPDNKITENNAVLPTGKKPDLRGFEWHYYQHLLDSSAAVFSGHGASVSAAAFTSHGQLVTLDQNGQVRRWDLGSQSEDEASRRDLPGGTGAQVRVLSPDGRLAALAVAKKVHVFDTATGKEHFQIDSVQEGSRRLIFTPDSGRLVIVDDKIRWCDAASGQVIASMDQKFKNGSCLALSADGLTLAVVGDGNFGSQYSIFQLDAATQKVTPQATNVTLGATVGAAALSPDGRLIVANYPAEGSLRVADAATGRLIAEHGSAHGSPVSALTFSGDGYKLVTADVKGTIKIWEDASKLTSKSAASMTLKGHEAAIRHVGFSSTGKQLVSTSADKTARVWDMANTGAAIRVLERVFKGCYEARFSPDGQWIAAADGSGVRLWDAATGQLVRLLSAGDKGRAYSVAFSPTDNRLLAVGYGGQADVSHVVLWDIDTGTELARLPGATDLPDFGLNANTGVVGALAFSPDGKYLVAGFGSPTFFTRTGFPNPLKVWEVATRRLIRRLKGHTGTCRSLDFSSDGKLLASGSHDGTAILWSTDSWKATQTLRNPDPGWQYSQAGMEVAGVAFAPDGKTLALASRGGTVQLWDVATGKRQETLTGHSNAVHAVAFSPDGRTLASGSTDQTVRLWNVATQRELMQLASGNVQVGGVESLAFSPDGKHLLAGGGGTAGGSTAFWSAAPLVWNDPDRAAEKLGRLLQANADFQSRIRMSSENLSLHTALAKLDSKDGRVQAALAAAQANWHASRQAWPEAVLAFDRLLAVDPISPGAWLRTPGLLRLATALVHQDRPRDAAALMSGGAKRRDLDGLPAAVDQAALGMIYSTVDGSARVTELLIGSPAARSGLHPGDVIVKVNDTELTRQSLDKLGQLLAGKAGTKVQLTVQHSGSEKPKVIELTRERFVNDAATGELLYPLRAAINERLAQEPRHPGLLELRAELAGQWSGSNAQLADYTAAIEALSQQKPEATADLQRLYGRRGNAHVALRQWQQALDDYARIVTDKTTDDALLSNQALALASPFLERESAATWTVLQPTEMKSAKGATLTVQPDDSVLADGVSPGRDVYTLEAEVQGRVFAVKLEALTDLTLPNKGPGRSDNGNFHLNDIRVTITPGGTLVWSKAYADFEQQGNWVRQAIDGDLNTAWGIAPKFGEPHWGVFVARGSGAVSGKIRITVRLDMGDNKWLRHTLGRFRLSVCGDQTAWERELKRIAVMKLTDPWQKLAAVYQLQGNQQAMDQLVEGRPKLAGQIGDLLIQDQDKDWPRALAIYSRGLTAATTDVVLLSKRARAFEALKNWDAAAADWTRAASGNPEGAKLLAEFAQRLAAGGQVTLANGHFDKAQALYERALEADPENDPVATELAQLLLNKHANGNPVRWMVFQPTATKTESGSKLTLQDDGSILVETSPKAAPATVRWQPGPGPVQALRIETSTPTLAPANDAPAFNEYQIVSASMATSHAGTLRGQFVRLDLPGDNSQFPRHTSDADKKVINLAELQVFQGDQNIALRKKARQSSNFDSSRTTADRAVDDNTVGNDQGNPYAHTSMYDSNPWWEVDLGSEHAIDRIVVWNRIEAGLATRMNHFRVRVLDHLRNVVFEQVDEKAPNPSTELVPPVFLTDTKSAPKVENRPLILRLPLKDEPYRVRLSVSGAPATFPWEEKRLAAMKATDPWLKLAAAYAVNGRHDEASQYFGRALQRADGYDARKPILELATRFDDSLSSLVRRQPDDKQLQLALARNLAELGQQRLADKHPAEALAELEKSHEIFTRLRAQPKWTVPAPTELKSSGGETLTVENGGSIFVSGPNPDRAVYTLKLRTDLPTLTAIRLESIPDARLPEGGAGRFSNGNFHVAEFTAAIVSDNLKGKPTPIDISSAIADWQANNTSKPKNMIDGNPLTKWDTALTGQVSKIRESHWAVFGLKSPARIDGGYLSITLDSGISEWGKHGLGRFRLSVTNEADSLMRAALHNELKDSEVVDVCVALAKAHAQQGHVNEAVKSFTEALDLAGDRAGKARIITEAAPLAGVLEKLAERAEARVPELRTLVPTSKEQGQKWRYTTKQPAEGWQKADFDDKKWQEGIGGFGTHGTLSAVVRTEWNTADIWLRREFTMAEGNWDDLVLLLCHNEDAEVYVNGVLAQEVTGFIHAYEEMPLGAAARSALKPGKNVFAVHCRRTFGGQYIDVGIAGVKAYAGRLAFAQLFYDRKEFAVATRLWAAALASDPKLGDDRLAGHRYNAVRAAALAAAGQGKDEPPQDDAAKVKLRGQAHDWLKAELTVWDKLLESGPPQVRPTIVQTLSHWQKNAELADIRDRVELAKLPADEQKAFTQFWADVAAVLKKAQEKPK